VSSSSSSNSDLSEEDKTGSETDASFDYEERSKEAVNKKDAHQRYLRVRGESPTVRKARKEAVKEDKRERRNTKVPKKVKKRKEKLKKIGHK